MVDSKKEEIHRIEESNKRMESMTNDIADLESALAGSDPNKIKETLKICNYHKAKRLLEYLKVE